MFAQNYPPWSSDMCAWWRSIVVRTAVSAGELSLSCARLMDGRLTTLWVERQPTRPTQPAIPPGSVKWVVTHYMGYGRWDLCTADWAAWPAAAPACVCRLHTVAVRQAARVSDESALEACTRRCATDWLWRVCID